MRIFVKLQIICFDIFLKKCILIQRRKCQECFALDKKLFLNCDDSIEITFMLLETLFRGRGDSEYRMSTKDWSFINSAPLSYNFHHFYLIQLGSLGNTFSALIIKCYKLFTVRYLFETPLKVVALAVCFYTEKWK